MTSSSDQAPSLGLLFGSFDPIHNGHMAVIYQALERCDEVRLIVQPINAYKPTEPHAPIAQRLTMAQLATQDLQSVSVCELDSTIDPQHSVLATLTRLRRESPHRRLVLLLGQDLTAQLPDWPDYQEILTLAKVFEVKRAKNDVASGQIKQLIKDGDSISDLVPLSVAQYITDNHIYNA